MTVRLLLSCGGCDATATSKPMQRRWQVAYAVPGGTFGRYHVDSIDEVTPDGWVAHDPYTGATYCPECWASIVSADDEEQIARLAGGDR